MDALTKPERDTLAQCEGIIERGLRTFIEVGTALMAIRNSRLYRERYGTFDAYVTARWPELSSRRAYQLMEAATVVQNLNPGSQTPTGERYVRPLVKLEPDQQRIAWERALESAPNGKVTALHVQRVVDQLKPRAVPADALFPGPPASADAVRVAMYVLLDAALGLLAAELGSGVPRHGSTDAQALAAARLLLESPTLKGAATMLAMAVEG